MLSLETAKALKAAGIEQKLALGDLFYWPDKFKGIKVLCTGNGKHYLGYHAGFEYGGEEWAKVKDIYIIPRLDQLLEEIEKRGYVWILRNGEMSICPYGDIAKTETFKGNSTDEAAAAALLWIYERRKDND